MQKQYEYENDVEERKRRKGRKKIGRGEENERVEGREKKESRKGKAKRKEGGMLRGMGEKGRKGRK